MKYTFKIGERVALYRTETDALGGDVREIPEKGSIGIVTREPYFRKIWMVEVEWEGKKRWYVRCCNLKRVKEEQKDVPFFNVAALEEAVIKPIRKDKWDSPLEELVYKESICEHSNLNSYYYAYNGEAVSMRIDDICYASAMRNDKLAQFGIVFPSLVGKEDYINWMLNESVFSSAFQEKDAATFLTHGSVLNCTLDKYYVIGSACALRQAHEYKEFYNNWKLAVDSGVDKHVAFLIATVFRDGRTYRKGDGHTVIVAIRKQHKEFVKGHYENAAESIYSTFYSETYGTRDCLVKDILNGMNLMPKDQWGYPEVGKIDKKLYVQLAKQLEEILK